MAAGLLRVLRVLSVEAGVSRGLILAVMCPVHCCALLVRGVGGVFHVHCAPRWYVQSF